MLEVCKQESADQSEKSQDEVGHARPAENKKRKPTDERHQKEWVFELGIGKGKTVGLRELSSDFTSVLTSCIP